MASRRSRLGSALVEALQHLKFLFRQERIRFPLAESNATEVELAVLPDADAPPSPPTRDDIRTLMGTQGAHEDNPALDRCINYVYEA
jgi:hypothetical protein